MVERMKRGHAGPMPGKAGRRHDPTVPESPAPRLDADQPKPSRRPRAGAPYLNPLAGVWHGRAAFGAASGGSWDRASCGDARRPA